MGSTLTEKILAHASGRDEVSPGDYVVANVNWVMAHDSTGPLAYRGVEEIGKGVFNPEQVVVVLDHFYPAPHVDAAEIQKVSRDFVLRNGISNFLTCGVCHQLLVERYVSPGDVVVGADSHTVTSGALGAFATGFGSTDTAGVIATGKSWFRVPESLRFNITGSPGKGVYAKDVIMSIISLVKADGALYKATEFTGDYVSDASLPSRFTLCNMAVEMGAKNGVIEADKKTITSLGRRGIAFKSDADAHYVDEYEIDVAKLEPMVACPPTVDNVESVAIVEGTEIDQAYLGTCTNGRLEDLEIAAFVLRGKRIPPRVRLIVIPASDRIFKEAYDKGDIETLMEAGGIVMNPGCGPCIGRHGGVLAKGEVCISSQNRNFTGRMGHPESEIYLGSPATVAASALNGAITDPRRYL
jgi:homoaconitate hydratase family protein